MITVNILRQSFLCSLFRTEVPDQLVVLDPNMAAVDENYVRILQRYKELLKNAGSMEDSDIEVMRKSPSKQAGWELLLPHRQAGCTVEENAPSTSIQQPPPRCCPLKSAP